MLAKNLLVLAPLLALLPDAASAGTVVYSPAGCFANADDEYETIGGTPRGGIWFNHYGPYLDSWASVTKTVSCPATRGDDGTPTGVYGATVVVEDNHATEKISCELRVGLYFSSTRSTTGTGRQTLVWGAMGRFAADDPVTLRCALPPSTASGASRILHYTVDAPASP